MAEEAEVQKSLKKLREPFEPNQISKLPKPTKQQTEAVSNDFKKGARCNLCGGWHHPGVVHLDYVGHAALTNRLLDVDPFWNWDPVACDEKGMPQLDIDGGMWIKLTICGVSRLGYGDAQGKTGPNATKERIGDALRNAAMRFGAALDLWHKGELHATPDEPEQDPPDSPEITYNNEIDKLTCTAEMSAWWQNNSPALLKESKEVQGKVMSYYSQIKALWVKKEAA